jgi:ribosomal protein L9
MSDAAHTLNRGMVIDVSVGDSVAIHPSVDARRIVVTVEAKSGQRSRIRIQSDDEVKIDPPKRRHAG